MMKSYVDEKIPKGAIPIRTGYDEKGGFVEWKINNKERIDMGDFFKILIALFMFGAVVFFMCFGVFQFNGGTYRNAQTVKKECEETLPRDQYCEVVLTETPKKGD